MSTPQYTWSYAPTPMITYGQARALFDLPPVEPVEPAKLSDCPHRPGTVEHKQWVRENVLIRQSDPRTEASKGERARISGLVSDRRVQMESDWQQRADDLAALIADLPETNVPIPPDPISYLDGTLRSSSTPGASASIDRGLTGTTITFNGIDMTRYVNDFKITFGDIT